jgi:hypothetical protein
VASKDPLPRDPLAVWIAGHLAATVHDENRDHVFQILKKQEEAIEHFFVPVKSVLNYLHNLGAAPEHLDPSDLKIQMSLTAQTVRLMREKHFPRQIGLTES